jgi:hypothetical protein
MDAVDMLEHTFDLVLVLLGVIAAGIVTIFIF